MVVQEVTSFVFNKNKFLHSNLVIRSIDLILGLIQV